MATFTVKQIIDGDTFQVSPSWEWNGQSGDRVRPAGYDAPEMHQYGGQAAKEKLARLIMGKMVGCATPTRWTGAAWFAMFSSAAGTWPISTPATGRFEGTATVDEELSPDRPRRHTPSRGRVLAGDA